MWLHRLAPSYRRNFYVNLGISIALVLFVSNVWRLGPHYAPLAVLGLIGLALAYICIWPTIQLIRAKPRPGIAAFVLAGAYVSALAYVLISVFTRLPGTLLVLLAGVVLMWAFFIAYRGIVLPSLFDRNGRLGSRFKTVREAQRASRDEVLATLRSNRNG